MDKMDKGTGLKCQFCGKQIGMGETLYILRLYPLMIDLCAEDRERVLEYIKREAIY